MLPSSPPRWADRLIELFCADQLREEIQGDLHEAYYWRLEEKGEKRAKWLFVFEVIRSIRFSRLKPIYYLNQYVMMYRNYVKTGWRFLKKHKLYSGLNILGLSLGISFCWLAWLHANDETNFDKHLEDHEKLYRIVSDFKRGDDVHYIGGSSNAMSVQFKEKIPEIEGVARFKSSYGLIRKGDETIPQPFVMADQEIIDYLDISFLEGTAGSFDLPNDVIISESLAGILDIRGKAVGEIISLTRGGDFEEFIVRGVYKDIPANTSVRRDMIISYANHIANAPERRLTTWFDINMNTLVKLNDPKSKTAAEAKMNELHQENEPDDVEKGHTVILHLQPISQIHLDPRYGHYNGISRGGNTEMIRLFIGIGLFCLIISMINYSNFNISLYINRAREVALRKVVGAERSGIFSQLITESFISSLLSAGFALILMLLILPVFSEFVRKEYTFQYLLDGQFILGAIGILISVAVISGTYPAFILSRFSIIKSLKGEQKIKSGKWITQSLLGLQFVIATILVAGMITMQRQIKFLSTFDTKVDYENVIYLQSVPGEENDIKAFINTLSQMPEVASIASTGGYNGTRVFDDNIQFDVRHLRIEQDLMSLLDIDILKGRNFDPAISSDKTQAILVNETLVKKMGLENPIGEVIPFSYGDLENPRIIGVVEDYHFESAKSEIDPLVIYTSPQYPLQHVYVKLSADSFAQDKFEKVWASYFDPFPFEFTFLEEEYLRAYRTEQRMMLLIGIGCIVSIFLAAMGLLGIVGLQLNQRLKEVNIRKVLGASAINLYTVFSRKFVLIITVGLTIGLVVGNYVIGNWLNNYPYHVNFGFSIIAITVLITVCIAGSTIVTQVLKVIKANPVKFLRDE